MACRWKDLTKKEIKHLRSVNIFTLRAFKSNHEMQERMRSENDHNPIIEPCWECKNIARKLGLPVNQHRKDGI